jgi:hypothetical protein
MKSSGSKKAMMAERRPPPEAESVSAHAMHAEEQSDELPPAASLLFAPIDKRAFGVAIGVVTGLMVFAVTVFDLLFHSPPSYGLQLLHQYFAGYWVTWPGAFIGLAWGFFVGFCAGWFLAFTRNLVLAISLFVLQTRAELDETRDFLDHI